MTFFRARIVAPDEKTTSTSRVDSPTLTSGSNGAVNDKAVIDPTKGGAVDPKAASSSKALEVKSGYWPWDGVVKLLEVDLFSVAWEVRHGAALALRELLKFQGKCGGMRGSISIATPIDYNAYISSRWRFK